MPRSETSHSEEEEEQEVQQDPAQTHSLEEQAAGVLSRVRENIIMGEDTGMSAKEYGDFVCDPLFSLLQTNNYERLFLHMMEATTALMSLQNPGMPEADKEQKLRQAVKYAIVHMGFDSHPALHRFMEKAWHVIAITIITQAIHQKTGREKEAQALFYSLLLNSLTRYDLSSICTYLSNHGGFFFDHQKDVCATRFFSAFLALSKHLDKEDNMTTETQKKLHNLMYDYLGRFVVQQLKSVINHCTADEAYYYSLEWVASLEQAGDNGQAGSVDIKELSMAMMGVSQSLTKLGRHQEAQVMMEKTAERTSVKAVLLSYDEIKALPVSTLKSMLQERGIRIPPGSEKGDLSTLLYEKAVKKAPVRSTVHNEIAAMLLISYANCLVRQEDRPELLPRAASVFKQTLQTDLEAVYRDDLEDYRSNIMKKLSDCLVMQGKHYEGLDLLDQILAMKKTTYGKRRQQAKSTMEKLKLKQEQQEDAANEMYISSARKSLQTGRKQPGFPNQGIPHHIDWTSLDDDLPSAMEFKAKVQEAANKRASSSSSPSSTKPTPPVEFDPTDEADTNYAVLMCLMGAVGVRVGEPKSTSSPHFNKEVKDAHTRQVYCSIVGVMKHAMESRGKLPSGEKKELLDQMYSINIMPLLDDKSKEEIDTFVDRCSNEQQGLSVGAEAGGLFGPSKPLKTCIGCGKQGHKMKKCGRCGKVFSCGPACFAAAWHAGHKNVCGKGSKK